MKVVMTLGILLIGLFLLAGDEAAENTCPPENVVLEASNGNVTFGHKKHAEDLDMLCTQCHHTMKEKVLTVNCHTCHGVNEEAPKIMKAFHDICLECHKSTNEAKGTAAPTGCKDCHVKE